MKKINIYGKKREKNKKANISKISEHAEGQNDQHQTK